MPGMLDITFMNTLFHSGLEQNIGLNDTFRINGNCEDYELTVFNCHSEMGGKN